MKPHSDAGMIRLLGKFQGRLETEIHCTLVPGTNEVCAEFDRSIVALDRKDWRATENWIYQRPRQDADVRL